MVAIELTALAFKALPGAVAMVAHAPQIQAASIGIPDTLFLMLLALVVFGPRRLPEIGRQIGKLMYEFRKVSNDFKFQMEEELRASEEAERLRKVQAAYQAPVQAPIQAQIDAPTQPALGAPAAEVEPVTGEVEPVTGEVRAEAQRVPQIAPPSTGETVAAQRPFRPSLAEAETEVLPAVEPVAGAEEEVRHG